MIFVTAVDVNKTNTNNRTGDNGSFLAGFLEEGSLQEDIILKCIRSEIESHTSEIPTLGIK